MFSKMSLIAFVTLFQIVRKTFIFLVFRSSMIASLIVKNWAIKTWKSYQKIVFFLFERFWFRIFKNRKTLFENWRRFNEICKLWCLFLRRSCCQFVWHRDWFFESLRFVVCKFFDFLFFDCYDVLQVLKNFFSCLNASFSKFNIWFVKHMNYKFFIFFERFIAFETLWLRCKFIFELTTFFAIDFLDERSEATKFLCDFDEFVISWILVDFNARLEFQLIFVNVVQWFINFYCWYFENNSSKFFSFFLFIMKLIYLTNY
jgi:hypothetical protein